MKRLAAFLLFAGTAASPDIRYFQFDRTVQLPSPPSSHACFVADAALFAHSAPGLADLRLYRDRTETPYLIQTEAPPPRALQQSIPVLNLGTHAGQTVFDAAMPVSSFSDLQIKLSAQNFIATVAVSGSQEQTGPATRIGSFTVFDLTRQRLGRSTVLHLPNSDFRYLHFRIAGPLHPENVGGLSIEHQSTARQSYVMVSESTRFSQKGSNTVIEFTVPARVPVDQIDFSPGPAPANFSRDVTAVATAIAPSEANDASSPPQTITSYGNLLRVHTVQEDHHIDQERLGLVAPQALFDMPAKWTVTIDNGDNAPLLPVSVRLQMLERDVCFEAGAGSGYAIYYGDPALSAPRYDLGQFVHFDVHAAARAVAQVEQPNPDYQPRPDSRQFTERHPVMLWIGLAIVVALLGVIAIRTARAAGATTS
jgi:hypothetical protein